MMRTVAVAGVGLAMTLLSARANAEETPPLPPSGAAASARPAGTVRLSLRSYRSKELARLYVARENGAYAFVCQSPCKADVIPGTPLRVTLGDSSEPHDFVMSGHPGSDLDVEVRPASKGPLAGGIVMVSLGAPTALVGLILLAVSGIGSSSDADLRTAGLVVLGVGGAVTVGGIALIANRSHEPRIREDEHGGDRAERATDSRANVFASDVATLRHASPVAPAFTPLTWGLSF